jgi:hypothetical protein
MRKLWNNLSILIKSIKIRFISVSTLSKIKVYAKNRIKYFYKQANQAYYASKTGKINRFVIKEVNLL